MQSEKMEQTKRAPIDIARDFVREQSCGEWGDELIEQDAIKLAAIIQAERDAITPTP